MDELAELRTAVARLTDRLDRMTAPSPTGSTPLDRGGPTDDRDVFWLLNGVKERFDVPGGVAYGGAVTVAAGPVEWQIGMTTEQVMELDWSAFASGLAALGHPVRLGLLQAIMSGAGSVGELAAGEGMGTTGQLYHHLNQLVSHGWLVAAGRGHYSIPPERIVPLMVILTASRRFA